MKRLMRGRMGCDEADRAIERADREMRRSKLQALGLLGIDVDAEAAGGALKGKRFGPDDVRPSLFAAVNAIDAVRGKAVSR